MLVDAALPQADVDTVTTTGDVEPTDVRRLRALVPPDRFFWVRAGALSVYSALYVIRFRTDGLIVDRISVAISVGLFLMCAFVGKPWRRWAILVVDAVLYAAMWLAYETTRGAADHLGLPLQVESVRNIDRVLFLGNDPNVWMQEQFFHASDVRWYDEVASTIYYTHFVVPVVALAVVWATSRVQWVRFMKRFATVLAVACAMFVLLPTAPPWMAADPRFRLDALPSTITRHTWRGFSELGFKGFVRDWDNSLDWANVVAAMPSLHAAFALFVAAFFLPMVKPIWAKALALAFPVAMLAALVYFAEHWVIDGIIGWAIVGASFWFWNRIERRRRRLRAGMARAHLTTQPVAG